MKQEEHIDEYSEDLPIDFVLAYENKPSAKREQFEQNLEEVGLYLKEEESLKNINFLKIHVPDDILKQYAEILKLRMPLKLESTHTTKPGLLQRSLNKVLDSCHITLDRQKFPTRSYQLAAEYVRERQSLYDETSPDYFNTSARLAVASYILEREKFGNSDREFGIKQLLADGVYKAAYPLHDGILKKSTEETSLRKKLLNEWASMPKWAKYQPLEEIKDYLGVKIALYYAWLGFYTQMLIPAAIVGFFCVVYGLATMEDDLLSEDICNKHYIMCPLCDKYCDFWEIEETCLYSKISYVVDNPATIFFAVFMSIWAALYLELWKRYSASIAHRWGLTGYTLQAEPPRPEYLNRLANAKKTKINVVTSMEEPVVPFWKTRVPAFLLSFATVISFMVVSLATVFGIIIYRMALASSHTLYGDKTSYRIYVVPFTAALINLVCISILNIVYSRLAFFLTELELHRTQTEFEDSLTLKNYLFQFINYYSSIFYIAFIKGKFIGYPGKYNGVLGIRQEECQPGGCLIELTIQLAIVMVGKQAFNAVKENGIPFAKKMFNIFRFKAEKSEEEKEDITSQCVDDYNLLSFEPLGLFEEYLEMVVQYGFVTIFVIAFPLAPLFALLNNIFELRLDAKKMVNFYRRPVPKRVKDIGVWYRIMEMVCRLSIVSNGFIIAYTSHFIPKLLYNMEYNQNSINDQGYLDFILSSFDVKDFEDGHGPINNPNNVTVCHFTDFRNSHDVDEKYERPLDYWHIMTARLAFLVVYQNLVLVMVAIIQNMIPDISTKLADRIQQEAYQINESIIKKERATRQRDNRRAFERIVRAVHSEENENSTISQKSS